MQDNREETKMYIGEQLINPSQERLTLSAQLGVKNIVIDTRPNPHVSDEGGFWQGEKVKAHKEWVESFGHTLEVMALNTDSILLDSIYNLEKAKATAKRLVNDIEQAAKGGVMKLKYNVQKVGITRTNYKIGRGGVRSSEFICRDYDVEKDKAFSYWGVGYPGSHSKTGDMNVNSLGTQAAVGQVLAQEIKGVTEAQAWSAITFMLEHILPVAEREGVCLAGHPQDPAYPRAGLNGVHHVVGSIEGMRKFLNIAPESPSHGFNFCQGTIAEMSPNPNEYVLQAIKEFGAMGKIFMVHFRNIKGGFLNFYECFPDEGSVDMAACIKAYKEIGYKGILVPDHVPMSELDPNRERFFAFALGHTKGLLQANNL
jgi:mannonate dehydratase